MKKNSFIAIPFLILFAVLLTGEPAVADTYGLQNRWALGIDEGTGCPGDIDDGWTHSATVSLSRCPKNPSPTQTSGNGAAFKNGPVNGGGQAGVETTSSQTFVLPFSESHELTFSALIVCVRCDYLIAEIYGDGQYLGDLLNYTEGMQSCGSWGWGRYCGDPLIVSHADEYEIVIRTRWTQSNSLGVKWTGLELVDVPMGATPTPTGTAVPTSTPAPTMTPTPAPTATATPTYLPLVVSNGDWQIICESGNEPVMNGVYVTCDD